MELSTTGIRQFVIKFGYYGYWQKDELGFTLQVSPFEKLYVAFLSLSIVFIQ